jgi:hypothetical protein
MRRLLPVVLVAALALAGAQPAPAKRPASVTIRAADINRDPMAVTQQLRARGLRVWAFVNPVAADRVDTIVDVRSQRGLECDCNSTPHDAYDEAAERRAEQARLRTVIVGRDWVRIPADYPYDLQVFVGRAAWAGAPSPPLGAPQGR